MERREREVVKREREVKKREDEGRREKGGERGTVPVVRV